MNKGEKGYDDHLPEMNLFVADFKAKRETKWM